MGAFDPMVRKPGDLEAAVSLDRDNRARFAHDTLLSIPEDEPRWQSRSSLRSLRCPRSAAADREHRGERCQSSAIVSSHEGSNYTASFEMSLRRPSIPLANDAGVRGVRVLSLDLERLSVAGHAYPGSRVRSDR